MTYRQKLEKCLKSITAHAARGNTPAGLRSMILIDRYDDLRMQTFDNEPVLTEWRLYCKAHGFATSHQGIDHFA
ncbi:hypothetical protein [Comamonas thiooxydans]|uniref:hypothetical protein n=1 Tax=Comamonas thiooxydans TaxID=363952 RepID=UPI001C0ECB68|nr:hypothetical protein [Comamonas thiooxydans]